MNVRCSNCNTLYRIDPARIPPGGVNARCARCQGTFRIEPAPVAAGGGAAAPAPGGPAPVPPAAPAPSAPSGGQAAPKPQSPFGPQDPEQRAMRLARALVSDIVAYHQDRWERSLAAGTLREDFRDEILKSWEEYVLQVGSERAHGTPYFRDALNEILAKGRQVF